ncbi:MAG: glycine-rich protein [Bacteroidia bacterium]
MAAALGLFLGQNASAQSALCTGDSLTLNLSGQTGAIQWQSSTDGGATWTSISGATAASLVDYPMQETWYRAVVTNGTCNPFYSDTAHVLRSNLMVDAGLSQSVCTGGQVMIGGSPTASGGIGSYTYSWTNGGSLSSSTVANPTATVNANTTYVLTVTDSIGCSVMDSIALTASGAALPGSDTFLYTGALQSFVVPPCVTTLTIEAWGAQGGAVTGYSPFPQGGLGARMRGTFTVTPGQTLNVIVGGRGNPDPSSSGGGGGSGVGNGNTPLIVAGGGGGHDFQDPSYTGVHAVVTTNGVQGNNNPGSGGTAGGDGGDWTYSSNNTSRGGRGWNFGFSGSLGQDGTSPNTTHTNGTWGLGGGGGSVGYGWCNCGGGGGGYSGGGSANINQSGGGGGSYNNGTNQSNAGGVRQGNGQVIITW